ncbi:MAG: peptidoglycan-binding protein [Gemmataceae bacterium]|nr:peptidoglycan-binding protein [Gemmataceae bacterium]
MVMQLSGSVGLSGKNKSADVRLVQETLNAIPAGFGGPAKPIGVDGFIGPETVGAITRFQKVNFGWGDGRVDVGGKTATRLDDLSGAVADGIMPSAATVGGPAPLGGPASTIDNGGKKAEFGKVTSAVGTVMTSVGPVKSGLLIQNGIMLWTLKNSSAAVVMIKTGKTVFVPASSLLIVGQSYSTPLDKVKWSQNGAAPPAKYYQSKGANEVSPGYFRQ